MAVRLILMSQIVGMVPPSMTCSLPVIDAARSASNSGRRRAPSKVDHPVLCPGDAAVERAVALPVGTVAGNVGPGEPGENPLSVVIGPLREQIDLAARKPASPYLKPARRRRVGPGVLPAAQFGVEGAKPEALDAFALIDTFEELHGQAPIQDFGRLQRPRRFSPTPVRAREAARCIPFSLEEIEVMRFRREDWNLL